MHPAERLEWTVEQRGYYEDWPDNLNYEPPSWSWIEGWIPKNIYEFPKVKFRLPPVMPLPGNNVIALLMACSDDDSERHPVRLHWLASQVAFYARSEQVASYIRGPWGSDAQEVQVGGSEAARELVEMFRDPAFGPFQRLTVGVFIPKNLGPGSIDHNVVIRTCRSYNRIHDDETALMTMSTGSMKLMSRAFPKGTANAWMATFWRWWISVAKDPEVKDAQWWAAGRRGLDALAKAGGAEKGFTTEEEELALLATAVPMR